MSGVTIKQQSVTVVKDKGGYYDTPITSFISCGYVFKALQTLSTIHQSYLCGQVEPGDTVEQYYANSIDTVVIAKPGEPDINVTVASWATFRDACLDCCIAP